MNFKWNNKFGSERNVFGLADQMLKIVNFENKQF